MIQYRPIQIESPLFQLFSKNGHPTGNRDGSKNSIGKFQKFLSNFLIKEMSKVKSEKLFQGELLEGIEGETEFLSKP